MAVPERNGSSEKPKPKPFWGTDPGIIAALAALITACSGCIGALLASPLIKEMLLPERVEPPSMAAPIGIPSGLIGRWQGPVQEPPGGPSDYSTVIDLIGCQVNEICGSVRYPELSCSGDLTLLHNEENQYVFQETITSGKDKCQADTNILIEKVSENIWQATYFYNKDFNQPVAQANLEKAR